MLTFLKLKIIGFGSIYNETNLDLDSKQTTLIKAPNGSGKSTIFSALSWVLYGKTLKGKSEVNTWQKYQDSNYKGTLVEITFNSNNSLFKIVRCQNYTKELEDGLKGKDRLIIYKDAEIIDIKGKIKQQEYIIRELGMSFKLFINSIMFGEDVQRLITESNTDKKKLFEEIFSLNYLNLAKDLAVKSKKSLEEKVHNYKSEINILKNEINNARYTYKSIKEKEDNYNVLYNQEVDHINKEIRYFKSKSNSLKISDYNSINSRITNLKDRLVTINNKIKKARDISNKPLLKVISYIIRLLKKGYSVKALKEMMNIKKAFKDIDRFSAEKDKLIKTINNLEREYSEIKYNIKRKEEYDNKISHLKSDLKSLKTKKLKISSGKYLEKIKDLKSKLNKVDKDYQLNNDLLDNYIWLINDPLSNNGIKAYLFDSSLEGLNNTLIEYSKILGFRISFEVDLNSTKKDFVTLIERDGQIIDYIELSQGEKQLCDVAMAFALNESLSSSRFINLALLDEVFEHLDDENTDLILQLIQRVYEDRSLFVITHKSSLPLSNVKTLSIIKNNGRSEVKIL